MKRFEGARRKFPLNFVVSIIIVVLQVPRISLLTLLLTVNSWEQLQVEDRQHIIILIKVQRIWIDCSSQAG